MRCLYCQSTQVARKSRRPRCKRYYAETGTVQTSAVYRYYCHNAACGKSSFTHLPPGLRPYSPYREQVHLLALQLVVWSRTTYRRSAAALALTPATVYRWVTAYGGQLLPVAAILGLVRCSGVVGIDEKYVLVPKNDKPPANWNITGLNWSMLSGQRPFPPRTMPLSWSSVALTNITKTFVVLTIWLRPNCF